MTHRDSANGNRVGARGKDGRLRYAYGIDLGPIGARMAEFIRAAEWGAAEDKQLDVLRKRLAGARRKIRSLTQAVIDLRLSGVDAQSTLEVAQLATRQMRRVRDEALLGGCVEQLEARAGSLADAVRKAMATETSIDYLEKDSPSGDQTNTPNTTTSQPQSAKADYSNGFPRTSSSDLRYDVRIVEPQTEVEADLEKHGVDPGFIAEVAPELCSPLLRSPPSWGDLLATAESLAAQTGIHRSAWNEACRLMGQRGAAASVIATACKHTRGEVDRPGAYLRGMSARAASGELHLGRTFHGLKDADRSAKMGSLQMGTDPRSIGQLAAAAMRAARIAQG